MIRLPKFKMTWTAPLNEPLQALGMTDAFDSHAANFAGMDGDPHSLYIGMVIHQAFIDVQEEGTEAAAATAVMMTEGAPPEGPLFLADHPFLFLIQENKTGSLLFLGRVNDPAASDP